MKACGICGGDHDGRACPKRAPMRCRYCHTTDHNARNCQSEQAVARRRKNEEGMARAAAVNRACEGVSVSTGRFGLSPAERAAAEAGGRIAAYLDDNVEPERWPAVLARAYEIALGVRSARTDGERVQALREALAGLREADPRVTWLRERVRA